MGVNAPRLRFLTVVCATLVTAASIAVSGMIGWVGLVVPHLCRKLVGSNFRVRWPCSMLAGAAFLLLVDNLSRNLLATEIPIGILTAFTGRALLPLSDAAERGCPVMLEVEHLRFSFGAREVLRGVDLRAEPGSWSLSWGPTGRERPPCSAASWACCRLPGVRPGGRLRRVIPGAPRPGQKNRLYSPDQPYDLSLHGAGAGAHGHQPPAGPFLRAGRRERAIAMEALEELGIADYAHRSFAELSGGERSLYWRPALASRPGCC